MLVLSRKIGERIMISDNIVVTIMDISGGKVRIGIKAPSSIPIHREELLRERRDKPSTTNNPTN